MTARSIAYQVAKAMAAILLFFLAVGAGKMMQLGLVALLGDYIGFDAASVIGLGIFLLLAFVLLRLARWLAAIKKGRRS